MLTLQNVEKYFYRHKSNEIHVINDTSLELGEKGLTALLGPSGCGKTTLLNVIGGLDKVNKGKIFINGERITGRSSYKVDKIRNLNIGYIFQNYNLIDSMTVFDNVAMVLKMVGIKDKKEIREKVEYALDLVGMYRYRKRYCDMLSGGERQRVGIARAIVKNPSIIIADEPTGNLDSANTLEVMNIIKAISREKLVILVTHEENLAKFYADRVIRLRDGKVISDEVNSNAEGLDYRIENRIYLKDIKDQRTFEDKDYSLRVFNDSGEKMNLDIVISKGNLFIRSRDERNRMEIVDNDSSIELVDDHYRALTAEEAEAQRFHPEKLEASKPLKHASILNPFTMLGSGFKTVSRYHILKKILLLGFVISAMFITYSVSNIAGVLDMPDSKFVQDDKSYVQAAQKRVSVDDYLALEEDPSVDYAIPGDGHISMRLPYDEYWQTSYSNAFFEGSLSSINNISEADLITGKLPENPYEVVCDKLILTRLVENYSDIGQAGYSKPEELVGRHLEVKGLDEFTITGFTDKESPCIYVDPSLFINILANSQSEDEYYSDSEMEMVDVDTNIGAPEGTADAAEEEDQEEGAQMKPSQMNLLDYTLLTEKVQLTKDSKWPEKDYEVIVDSSNSQTMKLNKELKTKINGHKLKVVGYYTSETINNKLLVNSNMIKYQLILSSDNMTLRAAGDKAETMEAVEAYGIKAVDLYNEQRKEYRKSQMQIMQAFLLVGGVVIIISLIEIFLIMRASFLSRIKEVGTYRAIGVKKSDIYKMFSGEIIAITVCASIPGWLMMNYLVYKLQGISYLENMFSCTPETVIGSLILIFAFNLIFGLLPVFRTLIKRPAEILSRTDVN